MKKRCKHENADHLKPGEWLTMHTEHGEQPMHIVAVEQFRCIDCGAWLSLGESHDSPAEVQVEIRAAEIASAIDADGSIVDYDDREADGYEAAERGDYSYTADVDDTWWHAGYLAARIAAHDNAEVE